MQTSRTIVIALIFGTISMACEYHVPEPTPTEKLDPGRADFSGIAVLGGNVGAGFMDGALYSMGQANSFGAILAGQINLNNDNPISFQQPEISSINGFNPSESAQEILGKSFLTFIAPGESQLFKGTNPGEMPQTYTGPQLNNFSVPFIRTPEVLTPELSKNLFYARFASDPGNSVLIDELLSIGPTMVILQLGWQDILGYAMEGLTGNVMPDPENIESGDLTPMDLFKSSYQEITQQLLQQSTAEIILVNIPDVSKFPFFSTIGTRAFIAGQEVSFLADYYRDYNIQVSKSNSNQSILRPTIQFFADDPPHLWRAVIDDPALVDRTQEDGSPLPKWRQMRDGEHILWSVPMLPSLQSDSLGTTRPLQKFWFFTPSDIEQIGELVDQYNQVISEIAGTDARLHLLDWFSTSEHWADNGVTFNGVLHTYDITRSGIFSSDGTNFNSRGSALFVNELITFVNQEFGSNVPRSNPNSFSGNVFVNDF